MILRYATRDDLVSWYGSVPTTMRAIVIEDAGKVLGVAGIGRMGDHMQAFSSFTEELRPHKFLMARAAVMFKKMLAEFPGPVLAICSRVEDTAPALLTRLGFTTEDERLWRHG